MLALPNLEISCEDKFREETVAIAFRQLLGDWTPEHKTLFIIDEPWGYAYEVLAKQEYPVTVVITQSPTPEYWDDLLRLTPNALLAGKQTLDKVLRALKMATSDRILSFVPPYKTLLTPTEARVLQQLAWGKTNREIAGNLAIGEQSVANHLNSIYHKLDVSSREKALLYYWGMINRNYKQR